MNFYKFVRNIIVSILALIWLFPVAVIFIIITKNGNQYINMPFWSLPVLRSIPFNIISNFGSALSSLNILGSVLNTLLYAGVASVGAAVISALASFSLVHLNVKRPQIWFLVMFSGSFLPFQMFLLPLYIASTSIGLYDTRLGFTIIYLGICIPFALLLYRNYASKVPRSLIEAAKIDGCTNIQVFWKIFLPITKPAFLSIVVVQFIWGWNNLIFGMVLTESVRPIMTLVSRLTPARGYTPVPVILAGSILASIPAIILFLLLNRYFIEGLKIRASK